MKRTPSLSALTALTFLLVQANYALSQANTEGIGIGISLIDEHAALHIESPNTNKGLLLPRWGAISTGHIAEDERLLAYYSNKNRFIFFGRYGGLQWMYVNPWLTSDVRLDAATFATTPGKVAINTNATPTESMEVNGSVSAYYSIADTDTYGNVMEGYGVLPVGGIILWTGEEGDWPHNFVLCNGQTAHSRTTPNLTDRFIVGGKNNIGSKGGTDSKATTSVQYESGGSTQNRITSTENRPVYYRAAFIMRVY
ncbi:MAG: hypothetical protein ABJH98_12575 [Reichenbachiella sp.]|uniref:hypothetical protein n=1 Tax=Reichenbachiella sp. TaxID=2184521 RepID=UPI003296AAA7